MFQIERKRILTTCLLSFLLLLGSLTGCGSRQSNTGSFRSRLIDEKGDAIINARCFSLFADDEKVYSGLDGSFRLSELPAGQNNIIIQHSEFALEQYIAEVKSDQETVVDFIRLDRLSASNRISNVKVGAVTSTTAEITWKTYKDVLCNLHFGTTMGYGNQVSEERPAKEHHCLLQNLTPETLYHFKVQYYDETGKSYSSYDYSFKTSSGNVPDKPSSISLAKMTELAVVTVNWTKPSLSQSVAGYNLYRMKKGGDWILVNGNIITNSCSYSDTEAETGVFARYGVTAVNALGAESEKTITELTFIPGVVKSNITITKSDSPVRLTADLIVPMGVNMTVEAGSEFQISENDSFKSGFDEERVEIIVHGSITVNGTVAEPVKFSPLDGSGNRRHWAGIKILSSVSGVSAIRQANLFGCSGYALSILAKNVAVSGLNIKHSVGGVSFDGVRERVDVSDCIFDDIASVAVSISKSFQIVLKDSKITNSYIGIKNYTDSSFDQTFIRNTDIYATNVGITGVFGNSRITNVLVVSPRGINYENILKNDGGNVIDHNTIDAVNALIIASGTLNVKNNIFVNTASAGEIGIDYKSNAQIPIYNYNNIYGFSRAVSGCILGTDSLMLDPAFIGGSPYSYRLSGISMMLINDENNLEMGRYGVSKL